MQDPVHEIPLVIRGVFQSPNASVQRETLQQFYAPDASFDHPFFNVSSSVNSRENGLLLIFQSFRCFYCPRIEIHNVAFDKESNKLFLDCTQRLFSTFLPIKLYSPTIRSVAILFLQRGADGRFYVKRQEEYYQPQALPGKLIPGLDILFFLLKRIATLFCLFVALFFRIVFRYWRPVPQR